MLTSLNPVQTKREGEKAAKREIDKEREENRKERMYERKEREIGRGDGRRDAGTCVSHGGFP